MPAFVNTAKQFFGANNMAMEFRRSFKIENLMVGKEGLPPLRLNG